MQSRAKQWIMALVVLGMAVLAGRRAGQAGDATAPAIKDVRSTADRAKDYSIDLGGAKLDMVWIPVGRFKMDIRPSVAELVARSKGKEKPSKDEQPALEVDLDGFFMGKCEVTNGQYRKFKASHDSGSYETVSLNGDDQPVVAVSWNDATAFCDWLSQKTGQKFALPTEAQWEYACRAGAASERYWGDDDAAMGRYANTSDRTTKAKFREWPEGVSNTTDGYAVTAPVGRLLPNAYGLHNMIGNVWEWCADWYEDGYREKSPAKNPTGPASGNFHVLRGGAWNTFPGNYGPPPGLRIWFLPKMSGNYVGFRVVQTRQ